MWIVLVLCVVFALLIYTAVEAFLESSRPEKLQDDGLRYNPHVLDFVAYIMWADARPTRSELMAFKEYLAAHYKPKDAKRMLRMMQEKVSKCTLIDVHFTMKSLCSTLSYQDRFILFQTLYKIAAADDDISDKEEALIDQFVIECGMQSSQVDRIKEYYHNLKREQKRRKEEQAKQRSSQESSYSKQNAASALFQQYRGDFATLGLSQYVTLQDVKQAYRKLSLKYHPDRLLNASEAERKKGTDIFVKATDAYQRLVNAPLWTKDGKSKCASENSSKSEKKKQAGSKEQKPTSEDLAWAYGILNLSSAASNSQVRKNYRYLKETYERKKGKKIEGDWDSRLVELQRAYHMILRK